MSCNHNYHQSMKEFHYSLPTPAKPLPRLFAVNPFHYTQLLATTDLSSVTMVLLFLECHISGIIISVTLNSATFTQYNKSDIQLHCCGYQQSISFSCVDVPDCLSIHQLNNSYFASSFGRLWKKKKQHNNHLWVYISFLLGKHLKVEMLGPMVSICVVLYVRNYGTVFKSDWAVLHSLQPSLSEFQMLAVGIASFIFLFLAILRNVLQYLIVYL